MIIQCINCNKNFQVDSKLIPKTGRNLHCGSCNHNWFYIPVIDSPKIDNQDIKIDEIDDNFEKFEENKVQSTQDDEILIDKQNLSKNTQIKKSQQNKNSLYLSDILSYMVVFVISFVALIAILDTFKASLSTVFPRLEFLLYNLFESIKDIILFLKNLFL